MGEKKSRSSIFQSMSPKGGASECDAMDENQETTKKTTNTH